MSGRGDKKSKRRRRDRDSANDNDGPVRGSGVDYSKVADRHIDDDRFEKHRQAGSTSSAADAGTVTASSDTPAAAKPKVSSQMTAVMRLMAGMEERTISEKLADSNRPTWEQYKKDNEDKLNLAGVDQKKMDAYRKELDEQRDKMLTRGTNHKKEGKGDKKSKKKKKRKHRRRDDSYSSDSDSSDYYSIDDGRKSHKQKKQKKRSSKHDRKKSSRRYDSDSYDSDDDRKKSSKHKKKKDKKKKRGDDGSSSGDSYRLSSFFTKGSDDESK
mmetsp:Transcript_1591/g.3419  ORF Transcript_1591/g.3419 Transcript_1591/m.3419 type:complete len:270 (+) Transcript_1591:199-1008(+)|eukprot:CAMPEP_0172311234 /NCGR_PEP_ID=MMETSP1058-20130122/14284_1 /TAXON_ID=83371 /ORGANISM="Detonula confervacea, Strain CCMP 353" /LENGTH=269 /DNA_ID=CAMNT_0013024355 /DNA_START=115 /DNA_END=924 /DNA_ORIENTATION=-